MRSSERISRTPAEYADYAQQERQRNLRELLAILRDARERGAAWYVETLETVRSLREGRAPELELEREPELGPASLPVSPFQAPPPRPQETPAQGSLFG